MQNLYPTCCVLLPISFQGSLFFTKLSYICDLGTYLLATFICVINLPNLFSTYAYLYLTQIVNTTRILAFLVSSFHFNFYVDIWHELANYIVISLNFEIEAEGGALLQECLVVHFENSVSKSSESLSAEADLGLLEHPR